MTTQIKPRNYQKECIENIWQRVKEGSARGLIVMATGLGKTVVASFFVKEWREKEGGRILYLCHQDKIQKQNRIKLQVIVGGDDQDYGFLNGRQKTLHSIPFLFATFQTMRKWKDRFRKDEFSLIIVDESHHTAAKTYLPTLDYFQAKFVLGMTATPDRMDLQDIRTIYHKEIYSLPLEIALSKRLLTPIDYQLMTDEIQNLGFLKNTPTGRLSIKMLNKRLFIPKRDEEIAKIILEKMRGIQNPRIIIFCPTIRHCERLAKYLPNSIPIHSRLNSKEQDLRILNFRNGTVRVALTVDQFNEGIDIPEANIIVFLRSTSSLAIFSQQLGRGLRKIEGKDCVHVFDFVANCKRLEMLEKLAKKVVLNSDSTKHDQKPRHSVELNIPAGKFNFTEKTQNILSILTKIRRENTREVLISQIKYLAKKLGSAPKISDIEEASKIGECASVSTFIRMFGSLTRVLEIAAIKSSTFYSTWKDASKAAKKLGIGSQKSYSFLYKKDCRLPSTPRLVWNDFPGWIDFLGKSKIDHYKSWEEASRAAKKLGIKTFSEYLFHRKKDPCLYSRPDEAYKNFPDWSIFLGNLTKERYENWQTASEGVKKLGIKTGKEYFMRYKEDQRLPSSPPSFYKDFPGWKIFLNKK